MSKPECNFVVDAKNISLILTPKKAFVDEIKEDFEEGLFGQNLDGHQLCLVRFHVVFVLRVHCFEVE